MVIRGINAEAHAKGASVIVGFSFIYRSRISLPHAYELGVWRFCCGHSHLPLPYTVATVECLYCNLRNIRNLFVYYDRLAWFQHEPHWFLAVTYSRHDYK